MTAIGSASVRTPVAAVVAVAAGCAALVARPLMIDSTTDAVMLFVVMLGVGVLWPLRRASTKTLVGPSLQIFALGTAAFALGRILGGGHPPVPFAARFIVLNTLAAVAEEAFFRRLTFGALERHGAAWAITGSTLLFALVHVTVYGWWVLPLDLAAGLIFSWQRWSSGRWSVPAATHVLANVLVVI